MNGRDFVTFSSQARKFWWRGVEWKSRKFCAISPQPVREPWARRHGRKFFANIPIKFVLPRWPSSWRARKQKNEREPWYEADFLWSQPFFVLGKRTRNDLPGSPAGS